MSNDLIIKDPSRDNFELFMGESRVLKYLLSNSSDYPMKNIEVDITTVTPDGIKTKGSYAEIVKFPSTIPPRQSGTLEIRLTVPEESKYVEKDANSKIVPFRLLISAKGVKFIEEVI